MMRSLLLVLVVTLGIAGRASAGSIMIELTTEFSGASDPGGSAPWLRAIFKDVVGGVELTLTSLLQSSSEFLGDKGWYFNIDPTLDATALAINQVAGSKVGSFNDPTILTTNNPADPDFKADGDGYFDIRFSFSNNATNGFGINDEVKYLISGGSVSASSFDFLSAPGGGNGSWGSAAHVQGIGSSTSQSGWIGGNPVPVPLPAAAWMGMGLMASMGGISAWRKRRLQQA